MQYPVRCLPDLSAVIICLFKGAFRVYPSTRLSDESVHSLQVHFQSLEMGVDQSDASVNMIGPFLQVSFHTIPVGSTRCQCGDHLPQRGVVHAAENSAQCSGQVALSSPAASHPGR